jgi:hypothetical protein
MTLYLFLLPMRVFLVVTLVACGAGAPQPRRVSLPVFGARAAPASSVAVPPRATPGAPLRQARSADGRLVPPRGWVDAPPLRSLFPERPAIGLRETWFAKGATVANVCREAVWSDPVDAVVKGADAALSSLASRLRGDKTSRSAEVTVGGVRVVLTEWREPIGHEGRGGLGPPLTKLLVCGAPATRTAWADVLVDVVAKFPSLEALAPSLELDGVHARSVTYEREAGFRDSVEVDVDASAAAQVRWTAWVVEHRLAVRSKNVAWALDDPERRRFFVLYEPGERTSGFSFQGIGAPR